MKQRAITAVFFAAAMIGGIYWNRYSLFWLFFVVATGSLWELGGLLLPKDETHKLFRRIAGVITGLIPVLLFESVLCYAACGLSTPEEYASGWRLSHEYNAAGIAILEILLIGLLIAAELFLSSRSPFQNIGNYLVGIFYIGIPIALMFSLATPNAVYHPHRVFGLLWLVWTNDTLAYLIGSQIGRRKLFPRISPNKTWEGTIGGALGTVGMAWLLSVYFDDYSPAQWLALGAVVGVFGTLGDLVESMLKRSAGVKDSGKLLPGHGGLLDRFDAFLFVLPFAWLVVMIFEN